VPKINQLLTEVLHFSVRKEQPLGSQRPPKDFLGGYRPLQGKRVALRAIIDPWAASGCPKVHFS